MTLGAGQGCATHPAACAASGQPIKVPLQHSQWQEARSQPLSLATHPFDVPPLGGRASQAEAYHVHQQPRDAQQVHGVPDEGRGDDVVDEEGPIVWQEHASGEVQ